MNALSIPMAWFSIVAALLGVIFWLIFLLKKKQIDSVLWQEKYTSLERHHLVLQATYEAIIQEADILRQEVKSECERRVMLETKISEQAKASQEKIDCLTQPQQQQQG